MSYILGINAFLTGNFDGFNCEFRSYFDVT